MARNSIRYGCKKYSKNRMKANAWKLGACYTEKSLAVWLMGVLSIKKMKHVLFICSQNKLRSPTAENIFADKEGFEVLSAGLNNDAEVPLTPVLVEWAETIFVMEKTHKNKLQKKFGKYINKQRIICLNIPDEYEFMDQKLIEIFKHRLGSFFATK